MQVRNLDDDVQEMLKRMARERGLSLSEYLRRTLTSIAERQQIKERWAAAEARYERERQRIRANPPSPDRVIDIDTQTIVDVIREMRGELPS